MIKLARCLKSHGDIMKFFSVISSLVTSFFGSSSNGKGIVGEASDTIDRWIPSAQTQQENSIEDLKVGDKSQESARAMEFISHDSWLDIGVDAANRLPRPLITGWAICVLFGWISPQHLEGLSPLTINILWTVVTFFFGSRVIFKDIPKAIQSFRDIKAKLKG